MAADASRGLCAGLRIKPERAAEPDRTRPFKPQFLAYDEEVKRWIAAAPFGTFRYWLLTVWLVSELAATRRSRIKLIAVGIAMWFGWSRPVCLDLRVRGRRLNWWLGPKSDLDVMHEIFTHGIYDIDIDPPGVILDLGSHIGASILAFRCAYPNAQIVGVEPDPRTFERLRRNTESLDVELRQVAVAPRSGMIGFTLGEEPWESKVGGADVAVEAVTLNSLIEEFQPDLLKVDIEGMELSILRELDGVRVVVGEVHGVPGALSELLPGFDIQLRDSGELTEFIATRSRAA